VIARAEEIGVGFIEGIRRQPSVHEIAERLVIVVLKRQIMREIYIDDRPTASPGFVIQ
jgi:hypothetical protein